MSQARPVRASPGCRPPGCGVQKDPLAANRYRVELRQSITEKTNPCDLAQLLEKPEQNAKMYSSTILEWAGFFVFWFVVCFHLQPFPQSLSENTYCLPPWRRGVTRPTRKVIYSLLTTEIIQHSKLGQLMDDLTLPGPQQCALRGPAAPLSAGDQRKGQWLSLFTTVVIVFRSATLRAPSRIVINLA